MSDPDKWGIDLTPDEADTFMAAIREARRGPDLPDPLVALRAEVEALREDSKALLDHVSGQDDLRHMYLRAAGAEGAYRAVLDLIDKHTREGQ